MSRVRFAVVVLVLLVGCGPSSPPALAWHWSAADLPADLATPPDASLNRPVFDFFGIAGVDGDLWVTTSKASTLLHSSDGQHWSAVHLPLDHGPFACASVAYSPDTHQVLVGGTRERLALYDGARWTFESLPHFPNDRPGGFVDVVDVAWSQGHWVAVGFEQGGFYVRDAGGVWTRRPVPSATPVLPDNVWSSGALALLAATPMTADKAPIIFVSHAPDVWAPQTLPEQGFVQCMAGSSARDVWLVGTRNAMFGHGGLLFHYDGATFLDDSSEWDLPLQSIAAPSPRLAVAVGDQGTVRVWTGARWSPVTAPSRRRLRDVLVTATRRVYVVGNEGTIFRSDDLRNTPR